MPINENQDSKLKEKHTIVFIGSFQLPSGNAAGIRIREVARLFQRLGFSTILVGVASDPELQYGEIRELGKIETDSDIVAWEVGHARTTMQWLQQVTQNSGAEEIIREQYSNNLLGVVCYNYPAVAQLKVARFARRMGAFAVADVTEWFDIRKPNTIRSIAKNIDTFLSMRWANRKMDGIITCSPYLTKYYQCRHGSRYALLEIPTFVAPTRDLEDEKVLDLDRDDSRKNLMFAGTGFDPDKLNRPLSAENLKDRLDWIVDLLYEVHRSGVDFHLDVFGAERKKYLEICPEQADTLEKMGDKINFMGIRPYREVIDTLKKSDFSIYMRMPSRLTLAGFPTKFTEAMVYGVPVLTNKMENIAPHLKDGKNGFFLDIDCRKKAVNTLNYALNMTPKEIAVMKTNCLENRSTSIENYIVPTEEFVRKVQEKSV